MIKSDLACDVGFFAAKHEQTLICAKAFDLWYESISNASTPDELPPHETKIVSLATSAACGIDRVSCPTACGR
jgi:hypothetical protein